jgi:hypothetical protein
LLLVGACEARDSWESYRANERFEQLQLVVNRDIQAGTPLEDAQAVLSSLGLRVGVDEGRREMYGELRPFAPPNILGCYSDVSVKVEVGEDRRVRQAEVRRWFTCL